MITVRCPTCEAAYQLDPARFPPEGRKLRCARCQTVWFAVPEGGEAPAAPVADVPVEVPAAVPEVSADADIATVAAEVVSETVAVVDAEPDLPPPPVMGPAPEVGSMVRIGGWRQWIRGGNMWRTGAILMLVLGVIAGAGVVVMKLRPQASHEELGPVEAAPHAVAVAKVVQPPEGVVLHRVRGEVTELEGGKGGVALTVRGLLANTTDQSLEVPPMRLELVGEDGNVSDMWPVSGVSGVLAAHAENAWTVSLNAPDMHAVKGWRVVFVEDVTLPPAAVEPPVEVSATVKPEGEAGGHGEDAVGDAPAEASGDHPSAH